MSDGREPPPVPAFVAGHLLRGALGFGLIGCAAALVFAIGPAAMLIAPFGLVALRGCPMCWLLGLVEALSARKHARACLDGRCARPGSTTM